MARAWLTRAGIIDDHHARRFLSRRQANIEELLWRLRRTGLGQRPFAYLAAQTRFYDTVVTNALDAGIDQVVMLGAGYDTRAWRLARPAVQYYEIDQPATLTAKRAHAPNDDGPIYVAADLAEVSMEEALADTGFQPARPSVICCEGLTMYLTDTAIRELLRSAAAIAAPGSRLGVDFGAGVAAGRGPHRSLRFLTRAVARAGGEPIISSLDPAAAPDMLAECGWTVDETLPAPALQDRFLEPSELPFRFDYAGAFAVTAEPTRGREAASTT